MAPGKPGARDPRRLTPTVGVLTTAVLSLLFYALLWKSGDLVDLPHVKLGFYNLCLWSEEEGRLRCRQLHDGARPGLPQLGLGLARLGAYGALVLCLFSPLTLALAGRFRDRSQWRLGLGLLRVSAALLSSGLGIFLGLVWKWLRPSELGGAFVALVGAEALLLLLIVAAGEHPLGAEGEPPELRGVETEG
ncbi:transmembrane protein 140 [Ornithorhynchus anatinus]|uniref:Transmembrane protein 140 n=1 Tax=Ornithorhynchus anatinus TaxID=9258 RepID=A0A6I8PHJ1_ORNAN|nr:transmembrane protein 140 [Ornithorhynchus anatinus]XP_028928626.1 transmembrane protein 140 [Ornithorhynchus anatinus]XP_028928627.1 transmembrane protein 140 [Ornithorhynchus anatinus]XP_028928628.1 transmembrane protein 140 [Ornithorhynchus anatinus]